METIEITKPNLNRSEINNVDQELMTPGERERLKKVIALKDILSKTKDTLPYYKTCKELGLESNWAATIVRLGLIESKPSTEGKRSYYKWVGGTPNRAMIKAIDAEKRKYQRVVQNKSNLRKKEAIRRKEEEKRALRVLEAKKVKEIKETRKSQGTVLDPNDHDFVNTLRAKSEGLNQESLLAKVEKKEEKSNNIPITVSVTTEGNKKTVCIQIEI